MKIAFLMDPLASIDPVDETTSCLMCECNQRGHQVFFLEPSDLSVRGSEVVARMFDVSVPPDLSIRKYWRAVIGCLKTGQPIFWALTELEVIFVRPNPPIASQAMEFLGPIDRKVFVINSVRGQILAQSKSYLLNFPDIIPETHVSRDPTRLRRVIDDFGGEMIVKPLNRFGGEGVIKVSVKDRDNLNSLMHYVRSGFTQ